MQEFNFVIWSDCLTVNRTPYNAVKKENYFSALKVFIFPATICNIFKPFLTFLMLILMLKLCAYNNNEALDSHLNAHIHCKNAFAKKYEQFVTN